MVKGVGVESMQAKVTGHFDLNEGGFNTNMVYRSDNSS